MTVKEQILRIYDVRYNEITKSDCEFLSGFFSSVAKYHTPQKDKHIDIKNNTDITMTRCRK